MTRLEKLLDKLNEEQLPDGSFGRFHTANSKIKKKIPTTEAAAWLMFDNSITRKTCVCGKICLYMERLLDDISLWPDMWETNKYFAPGVPLFIASKLALFGSMNKRYIEICNTWIEILVYSFADDSYSSERANSKAKELIGVEIDNSCIGLHGLNNIALFACNADKIPDKIQRAYVKWLYNFEGKIAYTTIVPKNLEDNAKCARVISLLSRLCGFCEEFI